MKRVSKRAEKLLREIIEHRNENGNCDTNYWKHRFEVLSASDNVLLRSLFKELREEGFISVGWADNYPYILYLLAKGLSYFEENEESEEKVNEANEGKRGKQYGSLHTRREKNLRRERRRVLRTENWSSDRS